MMDNQIVEKISSWLAFGGGIIVLSQFAKQYVPVTFGGRIKSGAFWAGVFSVVAAVFTYEGNLEAGAILPILSQGVVYWLTAHGMFEGVNAKARQAKAEAEHASSLMFDVWGIVTAATDDAWEDVTEDFEEA